MKKPHFSFKFSKTWRKIDNFAKWKEKTFNLPRFLFGFCGTNPD